MNQENIVCYRLVNGQDIIGRLKSYRDNAVVLENTMTYVISEVKKDGQDALSFSWIPLPVAYISPPHELRCGITIELQTTSIAFKYELAPSYIEAYINQTSLIQQIAKPGLIIPN